MVNKCLEDDHRNRTIVHLHENQYCKSVLWDKIIPMVLVRHDNKKKKKNMTRRKDSGEVMINLMGGTNL